ncbi:MAG: hypothetical protein QGG40_17875, partial [Myxococcota bacterium]|nr:hypothetical protein [Myxococcota bacterium]
LFCGLATAVYGVGRQDSALARCRWVGSILVGWGMGFALAGPSTTLPEHGHRGLDALAWLFPLGSEAVPGACLGASMLFAAWVGWTGTSDSRRLVALGAGLVLLALGPVLQVGGSPVLLGGRGVPLPTAIVEGIMGPVDGRMALVPAGVCMGLACALGWRWRAPWLGAILALLDSAVLGGAGLPVPLVDGTPPRAVRALSDGTGAVLHLPFDVRGAGGLPTYNARWLLFSRAHGRPVAVGLDPLHESALFSDPLVLMALNGAQGSERWATPLRNPGVGLLAAGVSDVVVHRREFPSQGLALLDAALTRALVSPQRDLADEIDRYPIPADPSVPGEGLSLPLVPIPEDGSSPPEGWTTIAGFMAAWHD